MSRALRLLTAAVLAASIPAPLMAQGAARPKCSARVEIAPGAYALATMPSGGSQAKAQAIVAVPPTAIRSTRELKPVFTPADGSGEVRILLAPKGSGLEVREVEFWGPYASTTLPSLAEKALVVDDKIYAVPLPSTFFGLTVKAKVGDFSPGPAAELEAGLRTGKKFRIWLLERSVDPNVRNHYAAELMLPDLSRKTGAIVKAMKKVQKDADEDKCARV